MADNPDKKQRDRKFISQQPHEQAYQKRKKAAKKAATKKKAGKKATAKKTTRKKAVSVR